MSFLKYIIYISLLCLVFTQNSKGNFLQQYEKIYESINDIDIESVVTSSDCVNELKSMKSIFHAILQASGVDEAIFFVLKDVVNHFPGLNGACGLKLPIIDTSKWDIEKFKEIGCAVTAISFALNATACINGGIFSCIKAASAIKSCVDCLKMIIHH
jgi:hypothetical protein